MDADSTLRKSGRAAKSEARPICRFSELMKLATAVDRLLDEMRRFTEEAR
jgi:hypothetical protein